MKPILEIEGLCKSYDGFALENLSMTLPGGCIMGLIGANGAGKTTTIKSLLGMVRPQQGTCRLLGKDVSTESIAIKEDLGVVMDSVFYVEDWRIGEVEEALAPFYRNWNPATFQSALEDFGLEREKKVKDLSRGMKVKLMLAAALSHEAKLLLLDEPTSGLDPVARDELMDILRSFVTDENHGILFSTHITTDLERIADYITYLQQGKVVFSGEKDTLLESFVLVKGGEAELSGALTERLVGLRRHSAGFSGMLRRQDLKLLPPRAVAEPVTLEDIMVFGNKEGL